MENSNLNLFTELLNVLQTAFSLHLCQFSQGRVFICEDKQTHMRSLEEKGNIKTSLASWQAGKPVLPLRSVAVSAISLCLVASCLTLWMRGASRDSLVLLALRSSSVHCSSVPLLLTARRQSLYSASIFFRYSCSDVLARSSSAVSNLATIQDGAPVWRRLAVVKQCL